jgi:predicted secreted protein
MAIKNTYFDIRYEMNGANTASNINPKLAQVKAEGFNTVTLALQVSVNAKDGSIDTAQHPLPRDFWAIVDYAKSIGLNVYIKAGVNIGINADGSVNGADPAFMPGSPLGSGVTADQVWSNVAAYEKSLAAPAQAHGVNGFYVGSNNLGFDQGSAAETYFGPVIAAVKSVYSGPVGYQAIYNNTVFGMVNIVDFEVRPSLGAGTSVEQIQNGWSATGYSQMLAGMANAYGGKTFIAHYEEEAQAGVGGTPAWQLFAANQGSVQNLTPNYTEQVLAYQAFVNVAKAAGVKGVGVGEFDPWSVGQVGNWAKLDTVGADLWNNPSTPQIAQTLNAL